MPARNRAAQERATYLTLTGLFLTLFMAFSGIFRKRMEAFELRPFDFLLLGLAVFRAGRLASFDKVTEPLREPFTRTEPNETGAGENVVAEGTGAKRAIGELISCPICTGTWIAALLTYALYLAPGPTRVLLTILGASGAAELLNASAETLTWTGQAARKESGQ
jgi:hypothetical protein